MYFKFLRGPNISYFNCKHVQDKWVAWSRGTMCLHGDGFQWFKMVGDLCDLDHDGGNGSDINCGYVRTVLYTVRKFKW